MIILIVIVIGNSVIAQNVQTNATLYSAQQLIEDILIKSNCISNVKVTNVQGGNFDGTDQSYGYFNASGSSFPFSEGLVLSTGKLANVQGPNTTLSDDNATNWNGDNDLELVLNESNTTNATIIEFEFTSVANQISFNYIFASEEYQENNQNTCNYSDLFGFLIRPKSEENYTNIALVPNTNTPVKVTTVHPNIPNGCDAINEFYFDSWNDSSAPINFNGQTKVLTATANVISNETYHVKLVIADEQNYRYDSAVFFEAGSFQSTIELGENKLLATNNSLCFNESLELDAFTPGANVTYKWFKNGGELFGETNRTYIVKDTGTYSVAVRTNGTCMSTGAVTIEFGNEILALDASLQLADNDTDGLSFFNLNLIEELSIASNPLLSVTGYFLTESEADMNTNPIQNPGVFFNTIPNQELYFRVENNFGCYKVKKLTLSTNNRSLSFNEFNECDDDFDGFTTFNLENLRALIIPEVSSSQHIYFFSSYNDVVYDQNALPDTYENTIQYSQEIWVKVEDVHRELLTTIRLNTLNKPKLDADKELLYCLNLYPQTITLNAGLINTVLNDSFTFEWKKDAVDLSLNQQEIEINEAGIYKVIVTNENNCSTERTFQVTTSEAATITDISMRESEVIIEVSGNGNYEFLLDNGLFQSENIFLGVSPGTHSITIKDLNGCAEINQTFSVFGFPKFFSPNNDGENDTWNPIAASSLTNPIISIYVFSRFGKLLVQLDPKGMGWNGMVNGKRMPSTDYWFKIGFYDGQTYHGHFSLIR